MDATPPPDVVRMRFNSALLSLFSVVCQVLADFIGVEDDAIEEDDDDLQEPPDELVAFLFNNATAA